MEIAALVANIIGIITLFVLFLQLKTLKNQIQISYEERKREKTVDILFTWINLTRKETSFAEVIAEHLNEEQCRKLYNKQPFEVNQEVKSMLCIICPQKNTDLCTECTSMEVKGEQLVQLRWYVMSYLNTLETVLVAWQIDAICKDTIEHQFSYLWDPSQGRNALERMRNAAGGVSSYPATAAFCEHIKTKVSPMTKPPAIKNHKATVSL